LYSKEKFGRDSVWICTVVLPPLSLVERRKGGEVLFYDDLNIGRKKFAV
jgi:hypothetical protein